MNRKTVRSSVFLLIIFFLLTITVTEVKSQLPFAGKDMGSEFNRGMELFSKEKYPAAIRLLDSYVRSDDNSDQIKKSEAEYYSALSALKLFNSDAEYRMLIYLSTHPESPRINEARLELGDYFYQNKNYRKASAYYEKVNRQQLESDKLPEYFFRYGYSSYIKGDKEKALLMFSEIRDIDTEYTPPAIYYFSQIAYENKMYQTAMEGFMRLKEDESFGGIVPFYIVQILYLEKRGLLSFTDSLATLITIREIIQKPYLILRNIQQEQRRVPEKINTSLVTVIIKQERLTRQLKSYLILVPEVIF